MTTIFASFKHGVMVCDSKCTLGDTWHETSKVTRIGDELIGFAGHATEGERWLSWYAAGQNGPMPKINNAHALILSPDGLFFLDSTGARMHMERGFMGCGSGGGYAVAAFMAGSTPEKAVHIACQIDANSGGRIVSHKLKGKR